MPSIHYFRRSLRCLAACALICCAASAGAQLETQPGTTTSFVYSIRAKAIYDGNRVILRWAPQDFETWNCGNFKKGYSVERTTIREKTRRLTTQEMLDSRVTLATAIVPLPEMDWENLADTMMAGIVAGCIYGEDLEVIDPANADMMSVVNTTEARQNRFGFSLFACDQNLDIALAAGLAYIDESAAPSLEYIYVVKLFGIEDEKAQRKGTAIVYTEATEMAMLPKPQAQSGDKVVFLNWEKNGDYISFIVERSQDNGQTFQPLNSKPFVSLSADGAGKKTGTYMDSLAANGIPYVYRVRGLSSFGFLGPPSDTVHAAGVAAPLGEAPYIKRITEPQTGHLKLDWEFPGNMENLITQFEVYRASTINGNYQFVSAPAPGVRTYTDENALSVNYYIVKSKDINGNYTESLPKLGQAADEQAPDAPAGLSGSCDNAGVVTISWAPSPEGDLKGYRVYTSDQNAVDSAFVQLTEEPVRDTFFRHTVNLNSLTDQMFYNVKAVDLHENTSPSSAYLNIQRADVVPPSAPSITDVISRAAAVELYVTESSSQDVVRYEFQKRWEGSPDWATLEDATVAHMVPSFVDSLSYVNPALRRRWYYYRVLAFDEAGLSVSSQTVRAKPLDQGLRPAVQSLTATFVQGLGRHTFLQWSYPSDVDLVGFQIYRGIDNSQLRALKFVSVQDATMPGGVYGYRDADVDVNAVPHRSVFTQPPSFGVVPVTLSSFTPNQPVNPAPNAPVILKYQIMAVFHDGGQSPMSPIVQVTVQ